MHFRDDVLEEPGDVAARTPRAAACPFDGAPDQLVSGSDRLEVHHEAGHAGSIRVDVGSASQRPDLFGCEPQEPHSCLRQRFVADLLGDVDQKRAGCRVVDHARAAARKKAGGQELNGAYCERQGRTSRGDDGVAPARPDRCAGPDGEQPRRSKQNRALDVIEPLGFRVVVRRQQDLELWRRARLDDRLDCLQAGASECWKLAGCDATTQNGQDADHEERTATSLASGEEEIDRDQQKHESSDIDLNRGCVELEALGLEATLIQRLGQDLVTTLETRCEVFARKGELLDELGT